MTRTLYLIAFRRQLLLLYNTNYNFRSLANLTAHKRSYCIDKYDDVTHVFNNKTNVTAANLKTVIVEGETVNTVTPADTEDLENYSPSLGTISFYC